MTVPTSPSYSVAALVAAHQAFLDLIDTAVSPGYIALRDSLDALLGTITLSDPAGTINGTTGQLTFTAPGGDTASASGSVAYGEICDGDGVVHLALPVQLGSAAVSGRLVVNTLATVAGEPLVFVAATLG